MLIINRYHTSLKKKAERHKSWETLNLLYSWVNGKAVIALLLVPMKYHNPWLKWNLFSVRLTRVINGSIEEPWYRLLYVTWKKIPLSTPPSSVVNIELWITQWQPCRDSGGRAKPATQSPQPGMQKIAQTPSQSRAEQTFFHRLCFQRRRVKDLLRPLFILAPVCDLARYTPLPFIHTPSVFLSPHHQIMSLETGPTITTTVFPRK